MRPDDQLDLYADAELPAQKPDTEKSGVPRVPEGQPSNGKASSVDTTKKPRVPRVPRAPLRVVNPADEPPPDADLVVRDIQRPSYGVYDDFHRIADSASLFPSRPGLYWHGEGREGEPVDTWIGEPLHVEAMSHDEAGHNFGRMLRFRDTTGRWREWLLPMSMLSGSGEGLCSELLTRGYVYSNKHKNHLLNHLMQSRPDTRLVAATRTGWHGDKSAFVLPNATLGDQGYRFQSEHLQADYFQGRGTLEGWRESIGQRCQGNPILVLSICTALAGALLLPAKQQVAGGAGLNLVGRSSRGKTTALQVAASVWGSPALVRNWSATGNGLESLAASQNDTLLALDELSQSNPFEAGNMVYLLANGSGKQRASRTGGIRQAASWRLMVLSSGERTLSAHMAEAGKKSKAGQEARLLDIPATNRRHGAFDELHGLADGRAFSDALKNATSQQYGLVGLAFVRGLMGYPSDLPKLYAETLTLPDFQAGDGVEARAAGAFALLAMAGELATEMNLTGWPAGEALNACIEAFNLWRSERGQGNTETRQILQGITEFIAIHGDSRFSDINANPATTAPIRNRAGYWEDHQAGRIWLLNSPALREAGAGYDIREITRTLEDSGW